VSNTEVILTPAFFIDIFPDAAFFSPHPPIFVRLLENPVSYYINETIIVMVY